MTLMWNILISKANIFLQLWSDNLGFNASSGNV